MTSRMLSPSWDRSINSSITLTKIWSSTSCSSWAPQQQPRCRLNAHSQSHFLQGSSLSHITADVEGREGKSTIDLKINFCFVCAWNTTCMLIFKKDPLNQTASLWLNCFSLFKVVPASSCRLLIVFSDLTLHHSRPKANRVHASLISQHKEMSAERVARENDNSSKYVFTLSKTLED